MMSLPLYYSTTTRRRAAFLSFLLFLLAPSLHSRRLDTECHKSSACTTGGFAGIQLYLYSDEPADNYACTTACYDNTNVNVDDLFDNSVKNTAAYQQYYYQQFRCGTCPPIPCNERCTTTQGKAGLYVSTDRNPEGFLDCDSYCSNIREAVISVPHPGFYCGQGSCPWWPLKDAWCFSQSNTVYEQTKGQIPIAELRIGDVVQSSSDNSFSRVYSLAHNSGNGRAVFVRLFVTGSILEISPDHLLYRENANNNKKEIIRARDVQIGDVLLGGDARQQQQEPLLGTVVVTRKEMVWSRGLYAPLTESGTLMVSGIQASNYVSFTPTVDATIQANVYHALLVPFRLYCHSFDCRDESYTTAGIPNWLYLWTGMGRRIQTWKSGSVWALLILLSPVLILLVTFEWLIRLWCRVPPTLCLAVVATTWLVVERRRRELLAEKEKKHCSKTRPRN